MVFKLVEKLASTSLGSIPNSRVSRGRDTTVPAQRKKRSGLDPAYETWLVPGRVLWVAEDDARSSGSALIILSDEEKGKRDDLSLIASIELRGERQADSPLLQNISLYVTDAGEIPATVINEKRLPSGQEARCEPGDAIVFGRTPSLSGVEFK